MKNEKLNLPYDPATMTVVIIDDQDPIRKAIRRVLSGMGFKNIMEFFDGSDALKNFAKEQSPIDLIVTDLYMRKVSGFQVLKKIRSKTYGFDIPIVVVTGEASKEDIVKAADLGADDYVLKPFQIADIEKKVTAVLIKYHSPPPLLKTIRQGERTMAEGHFQDALKIFEAAERLDPTSARTQHCKALALEKMGHAGDALKILKESAAANSTYYKNYATMADIHLKAGEKSHAITALKSELELNPRQPQRHVLLADMLMNEGDNLGALDHFREALKENPKMKEALIGMGKASDASDNQEKAIYYYKRARRQHPDLTLALELVVKSFEGKKEGRKAIPVILDDINLAPHKADSRIIASQLYAKYGETEKALKVLDDGLLRDPQSIPLLKAKAKVLLSSHDTASAVEIYQKVVTIESSSPHYMLLGLAMMHDQKYRDAVMALTTALVDSSDRPRILAIIAEVLKRTGNPLQGYFVLELALKSKGSITAAALGADLRTLKAQVLEGRTKKPKAKLGKAS